MAPHNSCRGALRGASGLVTLGLAHGARPAGCGPVAVVVELAVAGDRLSRRPRCVQHISLVTCTLSVRPRVSC